MLSKKINDYFVRKEETIPFSSQSAFLKRLSELLNEGYTFHESVSMLLPFHVKNQDLVIRKITEVQKNGFSVTEVFKLLGFSNQLLLPIKLATIHGQLQETLSVLGVQTEVLERTRKRFNNLLMYPLFLFAVVFLLFSIFRIYFLPNMESLLDSRNTLDTEGSIMWTNLLLQLPNYFLIGLLIVTVAVSGVIFGMRRKGAKAQLIFYKKVPIINNWYSLLLTRVFSREMGGLLQSGMSLQQAFDALITQEENKILQLIALQMKNIVVHGEPFSKGISILNHFIDDFQQFVIHGENSGYLGRELSLYSEFLTERIEIKLTKYLSVLQPILFLILAVFIVGAYLAILLPIYKMIDII